jgi:type 1 fimbria pilin
LLLFGCLVAGAMGSVAHASTCSYTSGTTGPNTLSAPFSGSLTVGRDVPVGTEIYRAQATSFKVVNVLCTQGSTNWNYRLLSTPKPLSSYQHPVYGNTVYQTSVPGIGVVAWATSTKGIPGPIEVYTTTNNNSIRNVNYHNFYFSLIKIGNVSAGTVQATDLPTFEYVAIGDNTLRIHSGSANGQVAIVASTCTTPDVSVDLGKHQLSELSGVGSATAWVPVNVSLNNCPAFFAATASGQNQDGTLFRTTTANALLYRLDPTTSVANASLGVMNVQTSTTPPSTTGIGIQMATAAGANVSYGSNVDAGLTLLPTPASYVLGFKSRYYQTAANPTPGQANGSVTVTLVYL